MACYTGVERRRSSRVPANIKVRVSDSDIRRLVPVLNISYHGALLKTKRLIDTGEIIDLAMYLPPETDPIDLEARVIRVVTVCSALGVKSYDIGVEFLNLVRVQKERLEEGIDFLLKKMTKERIE